MCGPRRCVRLSLFSLPRPRVAWLNGTTGKQGNFTSLNSRERRRDLDSLTRCLIFSHAILSHILGDNTGQTYITQYFLDPLEPGDDYLS
jgi:hypothetical protein